MNDALLQAVAELGFESPTPVQAQSIPVLLNENRDFIGLAQTGTGKTAAFGLPLLQQMNPDEKKVTALILAPTRELCVQIAKDFERFTKYSGQVRVCAVYGGASIQNQMKQLRQGVQVVVATPGRLIDLLDRKALSLSAIRFVVLDEADEMLNMGFQEDIDCILDQAPRQKRMWLFSATMPPEVREISGKYMIDPLELTVGTKNSGAANIEHQYFVVHGRDRYAALKRLVDASPEMFGIVFCRTKMETQEVAENLIRDGYNADALHGDLSQQQRDKVMGRYRNRLLQILVATDVAARGIDVNDVTHVIHFNLPDEPENYLHRSGRTARAGKSGISASIITQKELSKIKQLEKKLNQKFHLQRIPSAVDICERQLLALIKRIHTVEINEKGIEKYLPAVFEELADMSRDELIKRMVSVEFNRFLDYYRNAPDLNADLAKKDHSAQAESYRNSGPRMFINLGKMDGLDASSLQAYICSVSGEKPEIFGRIDMKGVYSFVDIAPRAMPSVLESFRNEFYSGRRVRVDLSGNRQDGNSGSREKFKSRGKYSSSQRDRGKKKKHLRGRY